MNYNFLIKIAELKKYQNNLSPKIKVMIMVIGIIATFKILTSGFASVTAVLELSEASSWDNYAIAIEEQLADNEAIDFGLQNELEHDAPLELKEKLDNEVLVSEVDQAEQNKTNHAETKNNQEIDNEQKIEYILNEYDLTNDQFRNLVAVVAAEAWVESYEDAYWVINTIYNRSISKKWIGYTEAFWGQKGIGKNLYYIATAPGQFEVLTRIDSKTGTHYYKSFLDRTDLPQYQAVIDFLYTKEGIHNFLSFKSGDTELKEPSEQPVKPKGNKYHEQLTLDDRLEVSKNILNM